MSWRWDSGKVAEAPAPSAPSIWLFIGLFVLVELAGAVIVVAGWPKGKPTMSKEFVFNAFVMPIPVWVFASGALLYAGHELHANGARWWNIMCHWRDYHWLRWTREHVALVDSVVLTPEEEIAERMLGLEGSAPVNPDKVLSLGLDAPAGASRIRCVLETLLSSLLPAVTQLIRMGDFQIVLQTAREQDLTELQRVMRNLKLPEHVGAVWESAGTGAPMYSLWGGGQPLYGARLVLACQLHESEEAPAFSEVAVALLLVASDTLAHAKPRIKPQAWLCRAIMAESDEVEAALKKLLASGQIPTQRLKQFWFTHLDKRMRHAVTAAVKDASLNAATQDIDRALGKPGHANGWLAQALAATMMQHGQGAQLVATPCRAGVALNVVGPRPMQPATPQGVTPSPVSGVWALGVTAITVFLFLLDGITRAPGVPPFMPWWAFILFPFVLVLLQVGFEMAHHRQLSADFDALNH